MLPHRLPALAVFATVAVLIATAAPLRAAFPLFSITPLDEAWVPPGYLVSGLNNSGRVQSYDPASVTGAQALRDGAGLAQQLETPPPGWLAFSSASRANLTEDGRTAVTVFSQNGQGTVGIGDFSTGIIDAVEVPPPNGDDDWSPRISGDGSFVVIQAGPDRGMLEPFLYDGANGWQPLGNLVAGGDGRPLDVNASGTVVGRTGGVGGGIVPFYYTDALGMTAITDGGATVFGEAKAINNAGQITGTANGRAFLFDSTFFSFSYLTPVADQRVVDINGSGTVLGVFNGPPFMGVPGDAAWVATLDDGFMPLENLLQGKDPLDPEWRVYGAYDINDDGWILADAYNRHEDVAYRVLLRPIPEPAGALLLLAAGGALLRRRRP